MKRLITLTSIMMVAALAAAPALAGPKRHKHTPKPDRARPVLVFGTSNDASYSNAITTDASERMVWGKTYDRRSKITMVKIEVKPCTSSTGACELSDVRSDEFKVLSISGSALRCRGGGKSCGWSFEAPEMLGPYQLRAWSYDKARNTSKVRTIRINVTL